MNGIQTVKYILWSTYEHWICGFNGFIEDQIEIQYEKRHLLRKKVRSDLSFEDHMNMIKFIFRFTLRFVVAARLRMRHAVPASRVNVFAGSIQQHNQCCTTERALFVFVVTWNWSDYCWKRCQCWCTCIRQQLYHNT